MKISIVGALSTLLTLAITTFSLVSSLPGKSLLENDIQDVQKGLFARKVAHYFPSPNKPQRKEAPTPNDHDIGLVDSYSVMEHKPSGYESSHGYGHESGGYDSGGYGSGGYGSQKDHSGIGGKIAGGVIGIVAISLIGLVFIPLLLLFPIAIILIGYNFPLVILIDNPNPLPPVVNARSTRSIVEDGSACIEKISCKIGRKSKTSMKILMHWISGFTESKIMRKISRGFNGDYNDDCVSYICSSPLLEKIF